MAGDSNYGFVVVQVLVVSMIVRIESIAGCEDENNLKTVYMTTAVGSSLELPCNVTNTQVSIWLRGTQSLTLGSRVYPQYQYTYSLHRPSTRNESTNISSNFAYNLMINDVTEDVKGLYTCQEQGCKNAKVNLSVEVPPVLWLETEHLNISNVINVTQNKETIIRCKAVGGKPPVSLAWEINGEDETNGVTSGTVADGVSSILNYRAKLTDRSVTCKTSGQIAVPSMSTSVSINVLYPPTCHLLVHNESSDIYTVTCVCVANPGVSSSVIIVNKFPYDEGNTVSLPVTLPAKIYCRAENRVDVYETPVYNHIPQATATTQKTATQQSKPQNGSQSGPVIIVCVLLVAIVITAALAIGALFHRKRSVTSSYFTWEATAGSRTLSNRPPCPSPVVTHRVNSVIEDNYSYVPSHDAIVLNGLSNEKPKVTLDAVVLGEGDEYNLQYFQIPRCSTENMGNEYAVADLKEDDVQQDGCDMAPGSSCASSFSDEQYFRSSFNYDDQQASEVTNQNKMDPYEWTDPNEVKPYEWAKPNKGKQKDEIL